MTYYPVFLCSPQEEYLTSSGLLPSGPVLDQTQHFLSSVKIDMDKYVTLFLALSPWAGETQAEVMAVRAFRVSLTTRICELGGEGGNHNVKPTCLMQVKCSLL